jgi:hypothetical protein
MAQVLLVYRGVSMTIEDMTVDEIAAELGMNRFIVHGRIKRRNIEPVAIWHRHRFYDRSVLPLIAEDLPTGAAIQD